MRKNHAMGAGRHPRRHLRPVALRPDYRLEPLGFAASRVEELFVAQELIKKVKLKCCGIKEHFKLYRY